MTGRERAEPARYSEAVSRPTTAPNRAAAPRSVVHAIDDNPNIIALWQEKNLPVTVVPGWDDAEKTETKKND